MEEYRTPLSGVITYIEEHLRDDKPGVLDNRTLAQLTGYSEFHFLRIFRKIIGLTPADYIRKRRLTEIVHVIMMIRYMTEETYTVHARIIE